MKYIKTIVDDEFVKVPFVEKREPITKEWTLRKLTINDKENLYLVRKEHDEIIHKKFNDNRYSDVITFINKLKQTKYNHITFNFIDLFKTNTVSEIASFLGIHKHTLRSYMKEMLGKELYQKTIMRRLTQLDYNSCYRTIELIHTNMINKDYDIENYMQIMYIKSKLLLKIKCKLYPIIECNNVKKVMKSIYNKIKDINISIKYNVFLSMCVTIVHHNLKNYNENNYLKFKNIKNMFKNASTVSIRNLQKRLNLYNNIDNLKYLEKVIK